ncbi:hypothetical protein MP638_000962, partial [Amoeboaphelidium occidentale]
EPEKAGGEYEEESYVDYEVPAESDQDDLLERFMKLKELK